MRRVFSAKPAILVHLKSAGVVLFVLHRVVVALLALTASHGDFYSHSLPPNIGFEFASLGRKISAQKINPSPRYIHYSMFWEKRQ